MFTYLLIYFLNTNNPLLSRRERKLRDHDINFLAKRSNMVRVSRLGIGLRLGLGIVGGMLSVWPKTPTRV